MKDAQGRCVRYVSVHKDVPKDKQAEFYLSFYCSYREGWVTERVFQAFTNRGWELDPTDEKNVTQLARYNIEYQPAEVRTRLFSFLPTRSALGSLKSRQLAQALHRAALCHTPCRSSKSLHRLTLLKQSQMLLAEKRSQILKLASA